MITLETAVVGVGPANLALLTAFLDSLAANDWLGKVAFLERSESFCWRYQTMSGGRLQVPFLKDLATQRNPRSRFTFLNYLHEHQRLEAFINLRTQNPPLEEISDYFAWVAGIGAALIQYGCDVKDILPVLDSRGCVDSLCLSVHTSLGELRYATRTVVLGCGRSPFIPPCVRTGGHGRVLHTAVAPLVGLRRMVDDSVGQPIVVVGAGQSALEATLRLLDLGAQRVELYLRGAAPLAIDDNPFVNHWYQSGGAQELARMSSRERSAILAGLSKSNRGVAERAVLDQLFRHQYDALRLGQERLRIHPLRAPVDISEREDQVVCVFENTETGERSATVAKFVVLATGFEAADLKLLASLADWIVTNADGSPGIDFDRRVSTRGGFLPCIYINGNVEDVFGPSDSTLSTVALRAGTLYDAIGR